MTFLRPESIEEAKNEPESEMLDIQETHRSLSDRRSSKHSQKTGNQQSNGQNSSKQSDNEPIKQVDFDRDLKTEIKGPKRAKLDKKVKEA